MFRFCLLSSGVMFFALAGCANALAEEFGIPDSVELCRQLKPSGEEPWRTIPWETSLIDAQHLAIKEKKPLFIWAMDGHPLGCT